MEILYYPGCTLKNNATNFEESALAAMKHLDIHLKELDRWYCCGTVFSMAQDNLMLKFGAIRNLIRVAEQEQDRLVTLCSMCYNTLRRANAFMRSDPERLRKVNDFMYLEPQTYDGNVRVMHLMELLDQDYGFERLKEKVVFPLNGLKLGAYYGCMLVRPQEFSIDANYESPDIFERMLNSIGAEPLDFLYRLECCGAYQTVTDPEVTCQRTYAIINSARRVGCEALVTSCPLCAYNLDQMQEETEKLFADFESLPVFYFSELLYLCLTGRFKQEWYPKHHVDPKPLLQEKNLINEVVV